MHGLSAEFLKDKPPFHAHVDDLLEFLADDPLVAHNAMFDLGFLNAEFERATRPVIARDRIVDTLLLARRKHPGSANRLDDLCSRYKIDNSRRTKHGALLDAELLAEVYLELIGARQALLGLSEAAPDKIDTRGSAARHTVVRARAQPLAQRLSAAERAAHREFVASLGSNSVWRDYLSAKSTDDGAGT